MGFVTKATPIHYMDSNCNKQAEKLYKLFN